jgi:hypothetical protein
MANGSPPPETVQLGPGGEMRLPQAVVSRLGWREGDSLVVTTDESGELKVLTIRNAVRSLRGMLGATDRRLADELIEERRREAKRE